MGREKLQSNVELDEDFEAGLTYEGLEMVRDYYAPDLEYLDDYERDEDNKPNAHYQISVGQ